MLARKPNAYPLSEPSHTGILETLEARITPANFFIGSGGAVVDALGNQVAQYVDSDTQDWEATLSAIGAESSFLFKKGDTLGFDSNGNGKFDKDEKVLLTVKSGAAVFFLNTQDEGAEIAGIAAGDKFGGTVDGVIGGIVTSLIQRGKGKSALYDFTDTIQDAQIRTLTVNGYLEKNGVAADITAGGGIFQLEVTQAADSSYLSAGSIIAGIAPSSAPSARLGEMEFLPVRLDPGENGASLVRLSFAGAVNSLSAGAGAHADTSVLKSIGGAGGSISQVALYAGESTVLFQAGDGGAASSGKGGAGGSVSEVAVHGVNAQMVWVHAGYGAEGDRGAGKGGNVSQFGIDGDALESLIVEAGKGASSNHGGSTGGSVRDIFVDIRNLQALILLGGAGGDGLAASSFGGAGGSVVSVSALHASELNDSEFLTQNRIDLVNIKAGFGGDGLGSGKGGAGGAITDVYLPVTEKLSMSSGNGGSAQDDTSSTSSRFGKAGAGGNIGRVVALVQAGDDDHRSMPEISVVAGDAGIGGKAKGGSIFETVVASQRQGASSVKILAGDGSAGVNQSGQAGGNGGEIYRTFVFLAETPSVTIQAGAGGDGAVGRGGGSHNSYPGGSGGDGGTLEEIGLYAYDWGDAFLFGGQGGDGAGNARGGNGGSIDKLIADGTFTEKHQNRGYFGFLEIASGDGGSVDPAARVKVRGGDGGNLSNIIGTEFNYYPRVSLQTGEGGEGSSPGNDLLGRSGKSYNIQLREDFRS